MFKICKIIATSFLLTLSLTFVCNAEEISNFSDLIEKSKSLDTKEITVKGEVIGEPMQRKDHTWINISDGSTAVGLWIKTEDVNKINVYGNYKHKGDTVLAETVFHRACNEHDGEMDFHVKNIKVISKGYGTEHHISRETAFSVISLSIVAVIMLIAYFIINKRNNINVFKAIFRIKR